MTSSVRTPQQRDHRFARARFITQAILLGSLTTSVLYVGYASNLAHSATTTPVAAATTPATTPTTTVTTTHYGDDFEAGDSASGVTAPTTSTTTAPKTGYTTPTKAPVTTTTVCTTTPSGRMVCH
jgi:hypothetical protein